MVTPLATALAGIVTALTAAAADLTGVIPAVAGVGIGVGLLAFGITYVVHVFKSAAH